MCQTKVAEKTKTHIVYSINYFRQSCCLQDNVGKYGTGRQAKDGKTICSMRIASWITKATHTQIMYYSLLFHGNSGYVNAPQCYVILTLPVLNKHFIVQLMHTAL